jgi:hypothetical protein
MKNGPVFCEKGVRTDMILSSMMTPGRKMKEVIVYGHVMDKKTSFGFAKFVPSWP